MSITAQEALNNVHAQWINEALQIYPKEIEAINKEIEKISIDGGRSIRPENFLKADIASDIWLGKNDLFILKRYFLANGFEVSEKYIGW
jgi:hypothetical protein